MLQTVGDAFRILIIECNVYDIHAKFLSQILNVVRPGIQGLIFKGSSDIQRGQYSKQEIHKI